MKKLLFALVVGGLSLALGLSVTACDERPPKLNKKEQDSRLIGTWYSTFKNEKAEPTDTIVFHRDGRLEGLYDQYSRKSNVFYTEGNRRLLVFVHGDKFKLGSQTFDDYYFIENDTLFIFGNEELMLARNFFSVKPYAKQATP